MKIAVRVAPFKLIVAVATAFVPVGETLVPGAEMTPLGSVKLIACEPPNFELERVSRFEPELKFAVTPVWLDEALIEAATALAVVPAGKLKLVPLMLMLPAFRITPPVRVDEVKVARVA